MSIKRKIPLIVLVLFAIGGGVALYLVKPPPEDPFKVAVMAYVDTVKKQRGVRSVIFHDNVVDIVVQPHGQHLFVSFIEKNGKWVLDKDLAIDFMKHTSNKATEKEILGRFGKRLHQRFRMELKIKEGLRVESYVDGDHLGVAGRYIIFYSLPKVNVRAPVTGRYIETFRYENNAWKVEGLGRIHETAFQR